MLVADDEAMVRASLRTILSTAPDIEVVAEAADGRQAVAVAQAVRPDVVLLDIRMPLLDGLGAATELGRTVPEVAVIMVTTFSEDAYIAGALDSGVSGFLLKTGDPYELMAAVRAAHDGACYLSPKVAQRVISAPRRQPDGAPCRGPGAHRPADPAGEGGAGVAGGGPVQRRDRTAPVSGRGNRQGLCQHPFEPAGGQQPSAGRGARPRSGTGRPRPPDTQASRARRAQQPSASPVAIQAARTIPASASPAMNR